MILANHDTVRLFGDPLSETRARRAFENLLNQARA